MFKQLKSLFILYLFFVVALSLKECKSDSDIVKVSQSDVISLIHVGEGIIGDIEKVPAIKRDFLTVSILKDNRQTLGKISQSGLACIIGV